MNSMLLTRKIKCNFTYQKKFVGVGIANKNAKFVPVRAEKILQMSLKVCGDIKDF